MCPPPPLRPEQLSAYLLDVLGLGKVSCEQRVLGLNRD